VAMDIVFREKKQNSNRIKGVEVLSILPKVKNAKRVIFYPNCINGLTVSVYNLGISCLRK
jgi:hypothetical protein